MLGRADRRGESVVPLAGDPQLGDLTDLILGVTSRNMPQMNVLMMSIPVKIVVGFTVLALAVRLWGGLVIHAFSQVSDAMGLL